MDIQRSAVRVSSFLIVGTALANVCFALGQRVLRGQPPVPSQPEVKTSGCPPDGTTALPPMAPQPSDFVELQRTSCFGSCPVYTVQIHADGHVNWRGERSVRVVGEDTATIKPLDARALIEKFRTVGFWNLCSSYSAMVTDVPTVITTVRLADQEKRVSNYFNMAPSWLQPLEYEIDSVADTHRWIHGDPRMETLASVRVPNVVPRFGDFITPGLDGDSRGPKPGMTPLMQAAAKSDIGEIQRQLSAKADPNAQDSSGWTPLMYATRANVNQAQTMKILLDAGANPNVRSYMGQTALMAVTNAYSSPLEKLRLLIAARADVNAQDNDGHTALMFAMYGSLIYNDTDRGFLERAELVSLLREAGARTDLRDTSGLTVFDYLDIESRLSPYKKSQAEKLRQILQNPTPGVYPPVRVSGRVIVSSGAKLWASHIKFQRVGVGLAEIQAAISTDGSFDFPMIPPGPYTVSLAPAPSFPLPPLSVVIPNKDVTALNIPVPAVKELSARIVVEADAPAPNFGLIFVASSGPAASSGPPAKIPADLTAVIPPNIQAAIGHGAGSLQLVRLGVSPMVDDATFRIALPSPWSYQSLAFSDQLFDGSFRITLPEGEYHVAAILPRLRGGLPHIYTVKSLTVGSTNLFSETLKIPAPEPAEIRVTFGTITPASWTKLSGRVIGIDPGDERNVRVILSGEITASISVSVEADGSFKFPSVTPGRYVIRVASQGEEQAAAARPRSPSDTMINVGDRDVTGIEINWRSRSQ